MFVGEIGFPRREFLHDIRWWEVRSILRGYNCRYRHLWSATRWQTYRLMEVQIGSDGMRKNGLYSPTDLIKFPWDNEHKDADLPNAEEIEAMQREMEEINAQQDQHPE